MFLLVAIAMYTVAYVTGFLLLAFAGGVVAAEGAR